MSTAKNAFLLVPIPAGAPPFQLPQNEALRKDLENAMAYRKRSRIEREVGQATDSNRL